MAAIKRKACRNLQKDNSSLSIKRRKILAATPDWSSMHPDLLGTILNHLGFLDKLSFKNACRSWRSEAEFHINTLLKDPKLNSPMLLMPTDPDDETVPCRGVFSLVEKLQRPLNNMPDGFHCIGSSKGWLILLQDKVNLLIYDPVLGVKVKLPSIVNFLQSKKTPENLIGRWPTCISKVSIWGDPLGSNYGVAAIYQSWQSKIIFAKHGDNEWTGFEGSGKSYVDIISHDDFIYVLSEDGSVESYRISCSGLIKVADFRPPFPNNISESKKKTQGEFLYSIQLYLAESKGDLLLVVRCIGDFVAPDGQVVAEDDSFEILCPYQTKNFYVYKLDFKKDQWEALKSLGDDMLFVGGNQTLCLPAKGYEGCRGNCVYFTDDNWVRFDEHYAYGGHDMGVFDLSDGSIEEIYDSGLCKMTPAFWINRS